MRIVEASGSNDPGPEPGLWAATLQCAPFYTDWSVYDRVDVYDDAIMPGSTYELDTILNATECKVTEEYGFSAPTQISTVDVWGDVVGNCGVTPCTVPDGVVDFDDITAVVEKFRNEPGAPIKSRADLINSDVTDPEPDRKVDFVDITFCVDAFRGFEQHPNPYPGPDPEDHCPYISGCYANITVDSNNDGEVNEFDDVVEDTSTMFLVVNSDDDDESGESDFNEAPVVGEDDLAEIQLTAACEALPELAWWSLSWDPSDAPIAIWLYPDKSDDGQGGGAGDPIVNAQQYDEWPPPEMVWLEGVDNSDDDIEITFTFDPGTASLGRFGDPDPTESDKVKTRIGSCTNRGKDRRYFIRVKKTGSNITRAIAKIENCEQFPLCPESCPRTGLSYGDSGAFVAVVRRDAPVEEGDPDDLLIANFGYARRMVLGSIDSGIYAETVYERCPEGSSNCAQDIRWFGAPEASPDPHKYEVKVSQIVFDSKWYYLLDDTMVYVCPHKWQNVALFGNEVHWETELLNVEDRLVGTVNDPCRFSDCVYYKDWGAGLADDPFTQSDVEYVPGTPGAAEWGKRWIDEKSFEVWDRDLSNPCE